MDGLHRGSNGAFRILSSPSAVPLLPQAVLSSWNRKGVARVPYLLLNLPVFSIVLVFWVHGTVQRVLQQRKAHSQRQRVLCERVAYMLWVASGETVEDD
jgi:hypothetical protein